MDRLPDWRKPLFPVYGSNAGVRGFVPDTGQIFLRRTAKVQSFARAALLQADLRQNASQTPAKIFTRMFCRNITARPLS